MNLQTRTKTTGRLARALIVGGLAVAAAGTMNGRDFMPGLASVAAQGPALTVIAQPTYEMGRQAAIRLRLTLWATTMSNAAWVAPRLALPWP